MHDITDFWYLDENGERRAFQSHEDHLELAAEDDADEKSYIDQIDIANILYPDPERDEKKRQRSAGRMKKQKRTVPKEPERTEIPAARVRIVIEKQSFRTLYWKDHDDLMGETVQEGEVEESETLPEEGLDKETLMKCSSLAEEFFTFNPSANELKLPVRYPRHHDFGGTWKDFQAWTTELKLDVPNKKYVNRRDSQMAHISAEPFKKTIIPWLQDMEKWFKEMKEKKAEDEEFKPEKRDIPLPNVPDSLRDKIHLYNALLQLGTPKFTQQDLIDELCMQMYTKKLPECELDLLEITVGRFHSGTVAVLDPVLNHLVGTYGSRDPDDRGDLGEEADDANQHRRLLPWKYRHQEALRRDYRDDRVTVPPELPVIGHSIKHWSGVRKNGSNAAAHVGYPLNVGYELKHWRRNSTDPIRERKWHGSAQDYHKSLYEEETDDYRLSSTHRLKSGENYYSKTPGTE